MSTRARQASEVLVTYISRLERVRSEYTIAIAEIAARLRAGHFRRSVPYRIFCDELAAVLGTEAARHHLRPSGQLTERGECSSALKALLDEDVTLFIAAVIDAHGLRQAQPLIESVIAASIRKPVLVVSNR
jgi:hypothetical protein